MEQAAEAPLKKTPLNARHRASGARMVPFGGWDMPVEYSGVSNEHAAVRTRAGLFDVSHTGEIGFEIFVPPGSADRVWQAILESGKAADVIPCGLGARDTLRLEAGMRLHGNDIDETTTAVEADLNWIVGWKKDDFIGARALREQKATGPARKIIGFEMLDRGIGRHGYDAYIGGEKAGIVT